MLSLLASRLIKRVFILFMLCGMLSTEAFAEDVVKIGGAGTGLGVMRTLANAFEKTNPEIKIKVLPSLGSSGGIKALSKGALDIAISGRALSTEESKTGLSFEEYAKTPFLFIVNRKVNKSDLTTRELVMIYNEELKTWPDGGRIRVVHRPNTDTDSILLAHISLEMNQAMQHARTIVERRFAVTDQEAAELVEKLSGSICGSTLAQVETEKPLVKVLSYNGIKPSIEALKNGTYPLSKPLYLVTAKNTSLSAKKFIKFLHSAKGQKISSKLGVFLSPSFKEK